MAKKNEQQNVALQLNNVVKIYGQGDFAVKALRGVSLSFRKNEFVSVLGPSGCGKTTMLNIIGGLDKYTEGDLIINGVSTKQYKDRDWDTYRNHSIGFVFQTYNLIPHQTVLSNVEMALTLVGVSKSERRARARKVLAQVGLKGMEHKKPNQMSGGQMQRVAIARALVNDPDIILADEPTGALDSETSVQVMEILKEIANDRLVIMVTHNPDLAERYSTRIVKMLDGEIVSDTNPIIADAQTQEAKTLTKPNKKKNEKKPSMSLFTSFGLSLRNLISKKARTTLTSFAGSIGIIGIALIYAVSQGATNYINFVQEETLSSYPLTIQAEHTDMSSMLQAFMDAAVSSGNHGDDGVYEKTALYDLVNAINSSETNQNDLKAFKTFIEEQKANKESKLYSALSGVQYTYDYDLLVYTKSVDGKIIQSDTEALMMEMIAKYLGAGSLDSNFMGSAGLNNPMMSMASASMGLWQEILPGIDGEYVNPLIKAQYELVTSNSRWPTAYNEVVLVVDEKNEIDDMTLFALGLKSQEEMDEIIDAALSGEKIEKQPSKWTFEEIMDMEFKVILNSDCYKYNSSKGIYEDRRSSEYEMELLYENRGIDMKVVGIVRPDKDSMSEALKGTICYTNLLTSYIARESKNSEALIAQLQPENRYIDIFTGLPFEEGAESMSDEEKAAKFTEYISQASSAMKKEAYIRIKSVPPQAVIDAAISQANTTYSDVAAKKAFLLQAIVSMGEEEATANFYLSSLDDEGITLLFNQTVVAAAEARYAEGVRTQFEAMDEAVVVSKLDAEMSNYTLEQKATYYTVALEFSESSYNDNLRILGNIDLDDPATVNLYASTFDDKDIIEEVIREYNASVGEEKEISYTDYVGLLMSSITTIINAITYVLIGFVAISLIVSSIMIGVITLISVQERIKEIGILRAIGASKRNISTMFNAETVLIGFFAGLVGVVFTWLMCLPINFILKTLTGIPNLRAVLPIPVALILVGISVLLTLVSGLIPSKSAAKKDPVVALRTE